MAREEVFPQPPRRADSCEHRRPDTCSRHDELTDRATSFQGPPPDVAIAGAGVAGLQCAHALSTAGLRVGVLEAAERAGGRAASWRDEATGEVVDIGPHVLTTEHAQFMALAQRLGTAPQVLWQPTPMVTLRDRGQTVDMPAARGIPPLHGLPLLPPALRCVSFADLLSNTRLAWHAARITEEETHALDGEDALAMLRRLGVSDTMVEWFFRSAGIALLNVPLERCSAASLMRVFRLMLGRSGYHFGFPRAGLADLYVPGCERAVAAAGGALHTHVRVRRVLVHEGRFAGFACDDGRELRAGNGVLALPPRELAEVLQASGLPPLAPLTATAASLQPSRYVCTMLWLDRRVTSLRFWARTAREGGLNTDWYDLANIREQRGDAGSLIACNAIHVDDETWTASDEHIIERTRAELAEAIPDAAGAQLRHARVHRVPMAVPAPHPGFERARPGNATRVEGLFIAGDWTATQVPCSMESAARSGARAAELVAARTGRDLRLLLAPPETTGLVALLRRRGGSPGSPPARG